MISVKNLQFQYPGGDFRLSLSTLQVGAGERVALIGPSGIGKTTLLNLLAGIGTATSGAIEVEGVCLHDLPDAGRRAFRIANIGMVFQNFELLEYLNVLDNILQPYRIHPQMRLTTDVRRRAVALAEETGLGDKLRRLPGALSQGERQRAAICRALVNEPKAILADEPTGNLDPGNKQRIMELLFAQATARNAALLVVTHDHGLLDGFDRVVDLGNMAGGRA